MRKLISAAGLVAVVACLALAEIGEPILIGKGRDPAWSPGGSKIAFLQRMGEEDRLMVKELDAGGEEKHVYTAPIVRFAWLDDSTIATQERKMPAIEGSRLKVSRIAKVSLSGATEVLAFDSVNVAWQSGCNLRLQRFADGSVGYYGDSLPEREPTFLTHAISSDSTASSRLFVETVPLSWGKLWLYYGSVERGRQITLDENTFSLPRLSPNGDKVMCKNHRAQLVVFDTLGHELSNLGKTDMESWGPSGQYISFCRSKYSHYDIEASDLWIAKYDGSDMRQLTDTPDVIETGGIFSPSGRYLAYTNERTREIYVIELD
jgi:Tol biopolymer transport system component